jgi:hypothetical protein
MTTGLEDAVTSASLMPGSIELLAVAGFTGLASPENTRRHCQATEY